jgi:hypothetical protein
MSDHTYRLDTSTAHTCGQTRINRAMELDLELVRLLHCVQLDAHGSLGGC